MKYTTLYPLNRCPTNSDKLKTSSETLSVYKPTITYLRVFRCIASAHVPEKKRKKLDNRGEKCVFIRYDTKLKAYKEKQDDNRIKRY